MQFIFKRYSCTAARDFFIFGFIHESTPIWAPDSHPKILSDSVRTPGDIWLQKLFLRVWYVTGYCSAGYDTPRNFFPRGIRPAGLFIPRGIRRRTIWKLASLSKETLFIIVCMLKLRYPRLKWSKLKEAPSSNFFFCASGYETPGKKF